MKSYLVLGFLTRLFNVFKVCVQIPCCVLKFMIWKNMWRYGDSDLVFFIHIIVVHLIAFFYNYILIAFSHGDLLGRKY